MHRPLAGIRILDLSRILAGPFATQLLADLGAEVWKVEPPGGDPTRGWGPPFADEGSGDSPSFRCANRGKRSRTLDFHQEEHLEHLERLMARADVLVENLLPETADRLRLSWEAVHARHPKLIVASVRGFASDVPAGRRAGYDFLIQAESGWMSMTGEPEGRPMKTGMALVDVIAALYLSNGIQAALRHRDQGGEALHVEVPLMEAAMAALVNVTGETLLTGRPPERMGNAHPSLVPYQMFTTRDGDVALGVGSDRQFEVLALWLSLDLKAHPEWRNNAGRVRDRGRLVAALEERLATLQAEEVLAFCEAHAIPASRVRTVDDVLFRQAGQLHHLIQPLLDPATGGMIPVLASPILLNDQRVCSPLPPPRRHP